MKKSIERIVSVNEFDKVFPSLISNKESFYAYFYAAFDKEGVSWCKDCNKVRSIVDEVSQQSLSAQNNVILNRFPIADAKAYKKPEFLYRNYSHIKLEKIPTLIYFREGKELSRLVEDQLLNKYDLMEFFNLSKDLKSKF